MPTVWVSTPLSSALVLGIFVLTYLVIAIQRIPGIHIDRPSGVMVGATLLLLTGLFGLEEAYGFVDGDVMLFLLGMLILVGYLEHSGFFEAVAAWLVRASGTPARLLAGTIVASGLLSAFFVNDTICLLFPPILLRATRHLRLNPVPYLIAIAVAANFGSALTVTGNPQNMFIGVHAGLAFLPFLVRMAVPVALALAGTYGAIRLLYAREIDSRPLLARSPRDVSAPPLPVVPLRRALVAKTLAALGLTLALFIAGVSYPLAALVGASLLVLIGGVPPRAVFAEVDWTLLLFFAGLFVVMGAFEKAGYVAHLIAWARPWFAGGGLGAMLGLAGVTALLSNLVSNVPAVILLEPLVHDLGGDERLWLLLALSSTFAGNLTLVGSVANVIVAEKAHAEGVRLGFWEYLIVGLPLSLAAGLLGTLWLAWT
jgi:Na+/H+ antiporter NhaD/arsenite permease-like protein